MFAAFDSNSLLCIEDETLDTGKTYQHNFQGYTISEKNKLFFVVHKKEIKLVELKNIGNTMGVVYLAHREKKTSFPLEKESFLVASQLFKGRDEQQGNYYCFLPYFSLKAITTTNTLLETLNIPFQLIISEKGVIISWVQGKFSEISDLPPNKQAYLSFLFWLTLLYGKFEAKGPQFNSIKIHFPLFGQYLQLQDQLENIIVKLQQEGIFLQSSTNEQQGKISFQITSNDWELLEIFAYWYKEIENFSQISKREQTAQIIEQLLTFLKQENIENRDELATVIKRNIVKIIVK